MICPACSAPDSQVSDSRPCEGGNGVRRRRKCPRCEHRWTTYEREETVPRRVKGTLRDLIAVFATMDRDVLAWAAKDDPDDALPP